MGDPRRKRTNCDEVAIDMDHGQENDMESVRTSVAFAHPSGTRLAKLSAHSVLPAIELSWDSITVKTKKKESKSVITSIQASLSQENLKSASTNRNVILDNICGVAYPGEVLAIMGASGAGKTSLLNTLTQRNLSTVRMTGSIRLNGYEIDKTTLRLISAYVQQDDLFIGTMTVIEHLRFMALLRMGKRYTEYEREKRIQAVMSELGLTHISNSIIGWPNRLKGISGGERKRLAFASEIMMGPPVLFCDEPTSGLDAFLAQQVVQVLKTLAKRKNMTVIITIHQPSSQVFEMFDKVCLMANGRLAFLGPVNEAVKLWHNIGYPVPENFNPGDHFISTLAVDSDRVRKSVARINQICDAFLTSEGGRKIFFKSQFVQLPEESGDSNTDTGSSNISEPVVWCGAEGFRHKDIHSYKSSWMQQFCVLTRRSFFVNLREPMLLKVRLIQTIFISLLLGIIYFNTQIRQTTVMNINGLMFQAVANMNFMFQFAAVNAFCEELPIFMREHAAHLYRVSTYFIAKNIADLAQYIIYPTVFSAILYWMSGFVRTVDAFALFTLSCVLMANVAISIAYAASCIFVNETIAIAVMPIVVIPLLAFGGFYINRETLPVYFDPVKYLSYFGYAYEAAAINQWKRIDYIPGCDGNASNRSFTVGICSSSIDRNSHLSMSSQPELHCCRNGDDVLASLSFNESNLIFDYLAMILMILILRLIAYFALLIRANIKK